MLMAEFLTAQDIIRCNPCWNSIKSVTIYIFQYIWEIHLILSMFREQIYTSKEDCCFKCNIIVFTTPSEYKYFGINSDFFFKCEQLLICSLRFWFINFFLQEEKTNRSSCWQWQGQCGCVYGHCSSFLLSSANCVPDLWPVPSESRTLMTVQSTTCVWTWGSSLSRVPTITWSVRGPWSVSQRDQCSTPVSRYTVDSYLNARN